MPIDANGNIIPDFGGAPGPASTGEDVAAGGGGGAGYAPGYSGPRKIAFICSKGNLDMAYPALIMANAALGEGIKVDIFFTFWGLDMVDVRMMDNLKFTLSGNTAMHMADLERFKGGAAKWSMPQFMGVLPGMTGFATRMMKAQMADLEIPTVREMIEQLDAMGANMWGCKLTVDMMKIKEAQLHPAVKAVISATDFIEISEGAQIIFI